MTNNPSSPEFFEAKYQKSGDPWAFAESRYELGRYEAAISALDGRKFRHAFEPGCSIGVLTQKLALQCDRLDSMDISPTAVTRAQLRCASYKHVHVTEGSLPRDLPAGRFDLIVFSEIGYYFDPQSLADLATSLVSRLQKDGVLLAVHWLGTSPDHCLTGDQVHEIVSQTPAIVHSMSARHPGFRIDRWSRS